MNNLNKKKFFLTIPSLLIIFLPISLITGPFLADLSVTLVSLIFLTYTYYTKDYQWFNNLFFKIFIFFYLYIVFTSIISSHTLYSLKTSLTSIRFILFPLAFYYLLSSNKNLLTYIFYSFTFCYLILIIDGHFQYFTNYNILGWMISKNIRVSSFFGDEYIMGSYLARLFPIYFSLFVFNYKTIKEKIFFKYIIFFIFLLSSSIIFLSGERVAFAYYITSLFLIIILTKNFKILKFFLLFFSILIILGYLFSDTKINNRMMHKTMQNLGITSLEGGLINRKYVFSKSLDDIHKTGLNIFKSNYFFGVGVKNFRKECEDYRISEYSCSTHPHNTYVQLLAETGIFGFIIIFSFFFYFTLKSIQHLLFKFYKKKSIFSDFQIGILCSMLITLFPAVPTGSFFNNWMMTVYCFPVGIWLWSLKNAHN